MKREEAIELVKLGFFIVPVHRPKVDADGRVICTCKAGGDCKSIGKHPIPSAWVDAASTDQDSIKAWWIKFRDPNAGVVTGKRSGVVVLDIDPRHGGDETLDDLQAKHGRLPETALVITGSGGSHFYFRHPGVEIKNGTNVGGSGVDFRGDGGFVVSPGSLHVSGCYYDWEASSTPQDVGFADMPKWLFDLIYKAPRSAQRETGLEDGFVAEGGRNDWLIRLAGSMRYRGCGYKPIFAALHYANLEHCNPPLPNEEVEIIAKSIMRYAQGKA